MKNRISVGFVALCADGNRRHQVFGVVAVNGESRNISSIVVAHIGIPLTHTGCVRAAGINGFGHHAYPVKVGRCMRIGMRNKQESVHKMRI